jgi:hypothetical protein
MAERAQTHVQAPAPAPAPAQEQKRTPEPQRTFGAPVLQRRCACGGVPGADGECAACKAKRLQRKALAERGGGVAPSIVHDVLRSPGRPLEGPVRTDMETRLGHDFSHVRVHTDGRAAASAAAVDAQAYTVGRNVVFGQGGYAPSSSSGRALLTHELAHVVQQGGGVAPAGPLRVGAANDPAEHAADRAAAGGGAPGTAGATLQRKVVVNPPAAASQIVGYINTICPISPAASGTGELSAPACPAAPPIGCECICDVIADTAKTYTINVVKATIANKPQKLWDKTTTSVPDTSMGPTTNTITNTIDFPDAASDTEFGTFKADGTAVWAPMWRILAHELCGHARLGQTYAGGPGDRAQHDKTIDTENAIAGEHGEPLRGHYADPKPPGKQGESYFNKKGDRSKIVYWQTDGLHYQAP